jgi:hypothetical protein
VQDESGLSKHKERLTHFALQHADAQAREKAFHWLFPVIFAVAHLQLLPRL